MTGIVEIAPEDVPPFLAARWPGRLPTLWALGDLRMIERPLVAVIGTRQPSQRGRAATKAWSKVVIDSGGIVLSGGAIGIDLEAHRAALMAGGATVLVPARGLLRYSPPRSIAVHAESKKLLLLTNLPPNEGGGRSAPVRRNALVAALADVVVVVESPPRSGTAYVTNRMRRRAGPIFAVDYDEPRPPSAGGNRALLVAGANILPERPTPAAESHFAETLHAARADRPRRSLQTDIFQAGPWRE